MKLIIAALVMVATNIAALRTATKPVAAQAQTGLTVIPVGPVAVAPGQPAVGSQAAATPNSSGVRTATPTAGIINAICSVTLNIVGCTFIPTSATLGCDTDGDGTFDMLLPLTNITPINSLLVRATLPATTQFRGTPF